MTQTPPLVLASQSKIRGDVLRAAGLDILQVSAGVDEDSVKESLRAAGASPRTQADALAELKAIRGCAKAPADAFVIGADQMLALGTEVFDKPADLDEARTNLKRLRGETHTLICACVIAKNGAPIWRTLVEPRLTMRAFSDAFLEDYLTEEGDAVLSSVGAYKLEGRGAQLFSAIEGDYFSILGLPLLPLLAYLREHGIAQT